MYGSYYSGGGGQVLNPQPDPRLSGGAGSIATVPPHASALQCHAPTTHYQHEQTFVQSVERTYYMPANSGSASAGAQAQAGSGATPSVNVHAVEVIQYVHSVRTVHYTTALPAQAPAASSYLTAAATAAATAPAASSGAQSFVGAPQNRAQAAQPCSNVSSSAARRHGATTAPHRHSSRSAIPARVQERQNWPYRTSSRAVQPVQQQQGMQMASSSRHRAAQQQQQQQMQQQMQAQTLPAQHHSRRHRQQQPQDPSAHPEPQPQPLQQGSISHFRVPDLGSVAAMIPLDHPGGSQLRSHLAAHQALINSAIAAAASAQQQPQQQNQQQQQQWSAGPRFFNATGFLDADALSQIAAQHHQAFLEQQQRAREELFLAQAAQHQYRGPPPPTREAIDGIPRCVLDAPGASRLSDSICTVCQDNFKAGETTMTMPCGHPFHEGCLSPWIENHNSCPTCRFALPPSSSAQSPETAQAQVPPQAQAQQQQSASSSFIAPPCM